MKMTFLHGRVLLALILAQGVYSWLRCFDCETDAWTADPSCEAPNHKSTYRQNCHLCHTVYDKSGDMRLIRRCVSEGEFTRSQYSNEMKYIVEACRSDLCNNKPINMSYMNLLQDLQDDADEGRNGKEKKCYQCSSRRDPNCKVFDRKNTPVSHYNYCAGKPCVVVHNGESQELLRGCFTWKRLRKWLKEKPISWTVEWCESDRCNNMSASNYPGCARSIANRSSVQEGCEIPLRTPKQTTGKDDTNETETHPTNENNTDIDSLIFGICNSSLLTPCLLSILANLLSLAF